MSLHRQIAFLLGHEAFQQSPAKYTGRLIAWRARCLLRRSAVVSIPELGVQLFVPPIWRGSAKMIYVFRAACERELPLVQRLLSTGDVFIDVGANYGAYTMAASRAVGPSGRVLSFEPATQSYAVLQRNVQIGRCTNVTALRLGLSSRQQHMVLRLRDDSSTNAIAHAPRPGEAFERIVTSTLDAELERQAIQQVHMVKIDVEGAEELVLQGASALLRRSRPALLFEFNPEAATALGLTSDGAWRLLRDHGYRFFQLDARHGIDEIRSAPAGGNVLAIHRSRDALAVTRCSPRHS